MSDGEKHHPYGPSSAHRWSRCTASNPFTEGMENKSSSAAVEGTLAHEIASTSLNKVLTKYFELLGGCVNDGKP